MGQAGEVSPADGLTRKRQGVVRLTGRWSTGSATMHASVEIAVESVEDALNVIHLATTSAPLFRNPSVPEEQR